MVGRRFALPFGDLAYFQGRLLLVSGSVFLPLVIFCWFVIHIFVLKNRHKPITSSFFGWEETHHQPFSSAGYPLSEFVNDFH